MGPHEKRMIPPARAAASTAADVQLAAVSRPTTPIGGLVSTVPLPAGTGTGRTSLAGGAAETAPARQASAAAHSAPALIEALAVRVALRPLPVVCVGIERRFGQ
jgi:hypothetical protein